MQRHQEISGKGKSAEKVLNGILYSVDLFASILLLTRQISLSGVYIIASGFSLAATGPILGGARVVGSTADLNEGITFINYVVAILLIIGQVRVSGPYVTSGRLVIVFSGAIFGSETVVGSIPTVSEDGKLMGSVLREEILKHYT